MGKHNLNISERTQNFIQNFYDIATVKWTPNRTIPEISKHLTEKDFTMYEKDKYYYGLPFTINNKGNLQTFLEQVNNTVYTVPEHIVNIIGADCVSPIICALEEFIKIPITYLSCDMLWDKTKTECIGKISFTERKIGTGLIRNRFTEQDFYESYAQCKIGDLLVTYFPKDFGNMIGHTRILTGTVHCVRNNNNQINPIASYFIVSENKHSLVDTNDNSNYGGLLNNEDYAVSYKGNKDITDITKWNDLKGKQTTFRFNRKIPFKLFYDNCYIPLKIKGL